MASALTAFPEDGDFSRIWLRGYNSGQIAALCFRSVKTISAQKWPGFQAPRRPE